MISASRRARPDGENPVVKMETQTANTTSDKRVGHHRRSHRYRDGLGAAQTEAADDRQTEQGMRSQQRSDHDRRDCCVAEQKANGGAEQQRQDSCGDAKGDRTCCGRV